MGNVMLMSASKWPQIRGAAPDLGSIDFRGQGPADDDAEDVASGVHEINLGRPAILSTSPAKLDLLAREAM